MFELSFATAGQEAARSVASWQRPEWLLTDWQADEGSGLVQPQMSLRPPVRPLMPSRALRLSRPGVSFKRPA